MKKTFLFLTLSLTVIISSSFIFIGKKPTAEGYYIKNNGDTNRVTFFIKTGLIGDEIKYVSMQGAVKFIDKNGEKGKIIPDEVREYSFEYLNTKYVYQTAKMSWNQYFPNKIFMKLEIDGPCKLYTYYQYDQQTHMLVDNPVLHKGNYDPYLLVTGVAGKFVSNQINQGTLSDYFSNCSQLSKKIKENELSRSKYREIVEFYNMNCKE